MYVILMADNCENFTASQSNNGLMTTLEQSGRGITDKKYVNVLKNVSLTNIMENSQYAFHINHLQLNKF